jgi:deazaflavin-dependent oxidoreductase (nitroreductase family)
MRDDVRAALAITPSSTMADRTIDITTTGRRSGQPRRIEIVFYRFEDSVYLSGIPGPRTRDWLANLAADPQFTFHLKHGVVADLPAEAEVITDPAERRRVLAEFVDEFNRRHGPDSSWGVADLDQWVEGSPLARVSFLLSGPLPVTGASCYRPACYRSAGNWSAGYRPAGYWPRSQCSGAMSWAASAGPQDPRA